MRVYAPLAEALVARCPIDLAGRTVLDHGAGTGAASFAARAARAARVVAVDNALGMLREGRASRPPGAAGDALALPFRSLAFDVVLAAFSLNHLDDPTAGVREALRVAREFLLASTYATDDDHPVKRAVDDALTEVGWSSPPWYRQLVDTRQLATVDDAAAVVERAGAVPERVDHVRVRLPDLGPRDLVRWRLGMAQCAAFVATHDARRIEARALELLGDAAPLERSVIFIVARAR
jgi:SAM-dependent methyltransferase